MAIKIHWFTPPLTSLSLSLSLSHLFLSLNAIKYGKITLSLLSLRPLFLLVSEFYVFTNFRSVAKSYTSITNKLSAASMILADSVWDSISHIWNTRRHFFQLAERGCEGVHYLFFFISGKNRANSSDMVHVEISGYLFINVGDVVDTVSKHSNTL